MNATIPAIRLAHKGRVAMIQQVLNAAQGGGKPEGDVAAPQTGGLPPTLENLRRAFGGLKQE